MYLTPPHSVLFDTTPFNQLLQVLHKVIDKNVCTFNWWHIHISIWIGWWDIPFLVEIWKGISNMCFKTISIDVKRRCSPDIDKYMKTIK